MRLIFRRQAALPKLLKMERWLIKELFFDMVFWLGEMLDFGFAGDRLIIIDYSSSLYGFRVNKNFFGSKKTGGRDRLNY
ncbi:MAG: hypothetical protein F6K35_39315 [Okeania sp. SIO2H7]|nr:hypothetical protein [Okeania sp. SIO2H7]